MIRIHAAAYSGRSQEPLFLAAPNARLRRCLQHPDRQRSLRIMAWLVSSRDRSLLRLSVACLQRSAILSTPTTTAPGHFRLMGPTITMRPDEEKLVWRLANSKRPSHRICPRKRISRSDAKGIIVGVHDRQP